MLSLSNKQIILGVTGGIAAYKSAELCRLLVKAGADVRVVMTAGAREFIAPLTFQALSGNRVRTELLDEESEAAMGHIELARWADLILVAPASANFIARLAEAAASDLLSTLCLASKAPVALAPAMNQAMWGKPGTQENVEKLTRRGLHLFGPAEGQQACGDTGPGRLLEPEQILTEASALFQQGELAGLSVTITAGPTREAIDPVRYISNHSSGKMGYALAEAAMEAGAKVTLVSGPVSLAPPKQVRLVAAESAEDMLAACQANPADIFIAVAAVADYRPLRAASQKIKKSAATMQLELVKNPDVLATIAGQKHKPFTVGFAAETENLESNALLKLKTKNLDLIFANQAEATFGRDASAATAYWRNGKQALSLAGKGQLARQMIKLIRQVKDSQDSRS